MRFFFSLSLSQTQRNKTKKKSLLTESFLLEHTHTHTLWPRERVLRCCNLYGDGSPRGAQLKSASIARVEWAAARSSAHSLLFFIRIYTTSSRNRFLCAAQQQHSTAIAHTKMYYIYYFCSALFQHFLVRHFLLIRSRRIFILFYFSNVKK